MPVFLLPYPAINPELYSFGPYAVLGHELGPFPIRWYALAYIAGLMAGWWLIRRLVRRDALWGRQPRPTAPSIDDLLVNCALGVIVGGRLGMFFYDPALYLAHPLEIFAVWHGGMAFHGGMIGAAVGVVLFARSYRLPWLGVLDLVSLAAPIGIFFGRIANFIKPELWGRPTDAPWAMVFPGSDGQPRHPSQLYEAALEGLVNFVVLMLVARAGGLQRRGLVTGLFGVIYGLARIAVEFFRDPDKSERLGGGLTMGMVLSAPMVVVGLGVVVWALRRREAYA